MKRLYFLATALLVTMVANSCVEEYLSDNVQQESGVPVKFDLSSREMLKVAVSDAGAVTWVAGDAIKIWDGFQAKVVVLTENDITNEGKNATISTTVTPEATDFVAVYPATAAEDFTAGGVVLNYPAQANGMNGQLIAVASTTAEVKKFSFKTFSSMVRFTTAKAGATTATLESTSGNVIAAKTTVSASDVAEYNITEENELNKVNIRLDGSGTYYFGLLPNVHLNGFKVAMYSPVGSLLGVVSSAKNVAIAQGTVLDLGDIDGVTSLNAGNVIFCESFNGCKGTGGNDGNWSGGSGTPVFDNDGWVIDDASKVVAGNKCVRFGMGSSGTDGITPALGITSDIVTVKFKIGSFDNDQDRATTFKLAVEGEGTLFADNFVKGNNRWLEYTVSLKGANADTKLRIYPSNYNKGRFFLDEFVVLDGGDVYSHQVGLISPSSIAVGASTNIGNVNWTFVALGNGNENVTRGGVSESSNDPNYYFFYGLASTNAHDDSEIVLDGYPYDINSVVVNVKSNKGRTVTASVYVQNTETLELTQLGESVAVYNMTAGQDVMFESVTPISGNIVIRFTDADGGYGIGGVRIN